ncbi:MAG: D-alanine--D-alanine ligase family protein [bacterium]|nr:D-alanine--D-alanine ligase family protein [bacterium]
MNIGVFFGSRSPEHDISVITGQLIIKGLREAGYEATPVYLDKKGDWRIDPVLAEISFFQKPHWEENLKKIGNFSLDLEASKRQLIFRSRKLLSTKPIVIDFAFPAFHGQNGEDGTAQGLFELANVPYAGCDLPSSAITIDKVLTKLLYEKFSIPTTKFVYFSKIEWQENQSKLLKEIKKLHFPIFIKPARLGSSIGIARVKNQEELLFAIEVALHYDEKVLAEVGVENMMDVTCAVLGDPAIGLVPSLLQESVFSQQFFSYEDKYLKGGGAQLGKAQESIIIPARLDKRTTEKMRQTAVDVFRIFGCSGTARIDFLYDQKIKKFFVNEINTLPGTLYHHLWKASGVSFSELLRKLVEVGQFRHQRNNKKISVFRSDVLKKADWSNKLKPK